MQSSQAALPVHATSAARFADKVVGRDLSRHFRCHEHAGWYVGHGVARASSRRRRGGLETRLVWVE